MNRLAHKEATKTMKIISIGKIVANGFPEFSFYQENYFPYNPNRSSKWRCILLIISKCNRACGKFASPKAYSNIRVKKSIILIFFILLLL